MSAPWILGLGTATPGPGLDQEQTLRLTQAVAPLDDEQERFRRMIYLRSGVDRRAGCVLPTDDEARDPFFTPGGDGPTTGARMEAFATHAPNLAAPACLDAMSQAGVQGRSITHLVTASCTGFGAPGVDLALIERLGLSSGVARTHIGFMGCHAAINALRIADALARCGERVLLCCVELCSLHLRYRPTADQIVANALFADGAAAAVVGNADRGLARVRGAASCVVPGTREAMSWRIGDFGFEMRLDQGVPEQIRTFARPWIDGWLGEWGLSVGAVGAWCIHPGGPKVLTAVAESLGLSHAATLASREVLAKHGNMSSPTVLFILRDLLHSGAWRPPGVLLSFGPGLTAEAALLD